MTDLLTVPIADADTPQSRRTSPGTWIVGVVLVVALIAAAVAAGWWVTHPDRFIFGGAVGSTDVELGDSMLFDSGIVPMTLDGGEDTLRTVTITDISPRVLRNGANAEVTLWLCTRARGTAVGIVSASALARFCEPATEISGEVGDYTYRAQQILVQITPTRPGRVVIGGFDVTYRDGIRRGSELAGMRITVATTS